ncbi:vWA domain-containing protein [Myxococcus sp. CA039A]|uniref:vWA domain-containing protein n=1 Tax=Myxococcus sp. CA039A TaxID=2741737 RepID=UPI00157A438E|nr:vWA domain-containing protein [Myxococcus sp. CA039A]NTX57264.1 VWA domain-containing protein [Myxococcus sp. CA039A]
MSKSNTLRPRAMSWLGAAMLCLFMSSQVASAARVPAPVPPKEPPQVDPCECGPLDVVFAIDDTGSMGGSLTALQANFSNLLTQIQTSSNGDYRLGLVTFQDDVTVRVDLGAGNDTQMQAQIASLTANGGWNLPEASDEALNTVIHNIAFRPNQNGAFTGYWRTGARRVVVLITDNLPGGFNDSYTSNALASLQAQEAYNEGIRIHAVYVPTGGTPDPTVVGIMQNYATVSQGAYRLTAPSGADVPQAVQDFLSDCRTPSDVFIRDTPADNGWEPSSGAIWTSPDIKVCNNVNGCASSTNPVFGTPNNYVFVTLRNYGPLRPTGPIGGSLHLYYLASGGNSSWGSTSWRRIQTQHNIFLDAGETRDIRIQWANVPLPGHYCLLARWVSDGDPMSYPEIIGSDTVTNTQLNNNIAWRNVDVVRMLPGGTGTTTYDVRPTVGHATTLFIRPEAEPFPGRVTLTLTDRLFAAWEAAGGEAEGLEGVEGTTLFFGGHGGALGLHTDKEMDERIHVNFLSDGPEGFFPMNIFERDDRKDPIGGVRYEVNVISPDTEPVAVELAVRGVDGKYTELTWPHTVHHKHYVVYRSENPEAGDMEAIGEVAASEDLSETTAVRFVDASDATRHFFYAVESHTDGNKTLSGWVTLGAPPNR